MRIHAPMWVIFRHWAPAERRVPGFDPGAGVEGGAGGAMSARGRLSPWDEREHPDQRVPVAPARAGARSCSPPPARRGDIRTLAPRRRVNVHPETYAGPFSTLGAPG